MFPTDEIICRNKSRNLFCLFYVYTLVFIIKVHTKIPAVKKELLFIIFFYLIIKLRYQKGRLQTQIKVSV